MEELCFGLDHIVDIKESAIAEERKLKEKRKTEKEKKKQENFFHLLTDSKVLAPAVVSFVLGILSSIITTKLANRQDETLPAIHPHEEIKSYGKKAPERIVAHQTKIAEKNLVSKVKREFTR